MAVSLSTRARRWLGRAVKGLQFGIARNGMFSTWSQPAWRDFTFERLAHEGYRLNAAVNICVQKLAIAYQQAPIVVKDLQGERQPDSELGQLMLRPNELMSWHELAIFIQVYKAIGGACRLHKVRDDRGRILELWPYHVGQIAAVPGEKQWIAHYVFTGDGQQTSIPREDIIDLRWPSVDPRAPWEPLPPLIAIAKEVDTVGEATRYLYALLYNDAVPMTVLNVKSQLKKGQFEQLSAQFNQRHGGEKRGSMAVVEGDANISRLGLNFAEMALDALVAVPEARIAAGFGIPAEYSGLNVGLQHSTYDNANTARRAFYEDTILPQATLDDGELSQELSRDFPGFRVCRDWSGVQALQENADAVHTRALNSYKSGLAMRNEARQQIGLPPVEELTPPPGVTLPSGWEFFSAQPTIPPELLPAADAAPKALPAPLVVKALQVKATGATERRIRAAVQEYLAGEYAAAADAVEGGA